MLGERRRASVRGALHLLCCFSLCAAHAGAQASAPALDQRPLLQVDLQQRLSNLAVSEGPDGPLVTLETPRGQVSVSAAEYVAAVRRAQIEQQRRGQLFVLLNITSPEGILWVSIGFLGQALFTMRMVLQWLASEKSKRSVVPVGFWWGSLLGGLMLLVYFIWRKDIVGIIGQSTGAFIYARNLVLIYRQPQPSIA